MLALSTLCCKRTSRSLKSCHTVKAWNPEGVLYSLFLVKLMESMKASSFSMTNFAAKEVLSKEVQG